MKKNILLLTVCLTLGGVAAQAQLPTEKPQQKIRIFIQEEGQEPHLYEYNSLEEMQADERLKDKNIPLLQEGDIRLRITQGFEREPFYIRREADSARSAQGRVFLKRELGEKGHLLLRDSVGGQPVDIFRIQGEMPTQGREITILDTAPLKLEELPADMQTLLQENGVVLKEGEKVVIVRKLDHLAMPPVPPAPPVPPVPGSAPLPFASAPVAPAALWLEELQISPNPANGQLRVQFRSATEGTAVLRLLDVNGKPVYEETIPDGAKDIDKTIQLPADSKGLHLLQIEQGGKTHVSRVYLK